MDLDRINELGFEKSSRWKSIVLVLSFSMWWNFFIACQCYFIFMICTFQLSFHVDSDNFNAIRYSMDAFYLLDLICVLAYLRKSEFKKLRYTKVRSWFFIVLDVVSLLPLELVYTFHYVNDDETSYLPRLLMQNRLVRIYRIFQLETFYETTIRKTNQFLFYMFLQYVTKAVLLGHVACCIWANQLHSVPCDRKKYYCFLWDFTHFTTLIMLNWSGEKESFRNPPERTLVIITLLLGFLLTYVYFYPNTLFVSMQLNNSKAQYYEKQEKLKCYLRNLVAATDLRDKITNYFKDVWFKDRADDGMELIFENVPLALQKEIFSDIFWEAFRHSELLRDVSRSCKRSLSLVMSTGFYHAGQILYLKGERKLKMLFLVQGIIQIMAEENEESPVLSFSSGTVFGEFSLFHVCRSQALLKCKSYCELQILKMKDAIKVLKDYPKDKKIVFHNLDQRLQMAKATQWRKQKFHLELKMDALDLGLTGMGVEDCVKWLKSQWRVCWEGHQRHKMVLRAKEEGLRLPSWHRVVRPEIKIEFISNYLDLIVLSDALEERKDVVCLKTKFPWSIDPGAPFLKIWRYVVLCTSFIPAVVYPFCSAWLPKFPISIYVLSYIVTLIFIIDLTFKVLTAIKTKHGIITSFSTVVCQRLQDATFFLDIIAALPYQIYLLTSVDFLEAESYEVGLPLQLAITKIHVFLSLKVPLCELMDRLTVLKNSMITILFTYWISQVIQLFGVRELGNASTEDNWVERFLETKKNREFLRFYVIAFIRGMGISLGIPDFYMYPDINLFLVLFVITKFMFFFFFCFFLGDFYGAQTVKIYSEETFLVLLKRIKRFLQSIYLSSEVAERLVNTVRFQWQYDHADFLSSKVTISKSIPKDLRDQIYEKTTIKTLRMCALFEEETPELLNEILINSSLVAIPAHSTLVMFGQINHTLSIIHRGYCQVTSFLPKDVFKGVGGAHALGPGSIFPVLSAFSNSPCIENVFTLTDCEIIMIQLNDLLTIMAKYDYFKDLVDVAKNQNVVEKLKNTRPGFTKPKRRVVPIEVQKENYKASFSKMGRFGMVFYFFCPKHIKSMKNFKKWESIYSIYITILCATWPCCFGMFLYISHILVPLFLLGNSILIVHLVLQFYAPYYNKLGILVTHPLYTSYNYLSTTFFFDFTTAMPVYHCYRYLISDPYSSPLGSWVGISFIQHICLIARVLGFLGNAESWFSSKYVIRLIKVILFFSLTFNFLVNYLMYLALYPTYSSAFVVDGFLIGPVYQPDNENLLRENSIYDFLVYSAHFLVCSLQTTEFLLMENSGLVIYTQYMLGFAGLIIKIYLYTWISSNSVFANITGTMYKEKITSFVKYLEFEKADDKLIEYAISYYNLEWSLTKGENLKTIFHNLPVHLHEELVYPLYRPTFIRNEVLCQADEGFFRILSTNVTATYFNRGSVVIFQNECQSDIYFVHRGKCFVYDWFVILDSGSIVGDLQRTGLMVNKVYALTHVEMLKVDSGQFFTILNSYDELEANFMYRIKNAENFMRVEVQVGEYQIRPVDSRDVLNAFGLQNKDISFEDESAFEDIENTSIQLLKSWKSRPEEKLDRLFVIYPGTWKMKAYAGIYLSITYFTYITIPIFMNFGTLTQEAFIAIGVLDALWLIVIILGFRVGYIDKVKGDVITDCKFTARRYATKWDGLVMDTLSLIPFEFLSIIIAGSIEKAEARLVAWLRIFRLIRGICVFQHIMSESRKITINVYIKYARVLLYMTIWMNSMTNIYIALATHSLIVDAIHPFELGLKQLLGYALAFQYTLNFLTSANICVIIPDTIPQLLFLNINAILLPCVKGLIISQVLSILFVKKLAMSVYKSQVVALENFLETRDTSSSIIKEVLKYKLNLLLFGRSENMPSLLVLAPSSLRIAIMNDLYMQHFMDFPLFEDVDYIFLKQLVSRLIREIYFPGQKIVEQNDVDHRMYFIHIGEIYIINQTKDRAYVEFVTGRKKAGDYFGEAQGLWFSLPHKLTYRARTVVEVVSLESSHWLDLRKSFPDVSMKIFKKAKALRLL